MIVTFYNHGTGKAENSINYLLSSKDHTGKLRDVKPDVIKGDAETSIEVINGISRKHKYSSGSINFRNNEKPTKQQIKKIIENFEYVTTGRMPDRVCFFWVLHEDKGNIELHFVAANTDLITGKQIIINPPGFHSQQLINDFQAHWNDELGYDQVVPDPLKASFSALDMKSKGPIAGEGEKQVSNKEYKTKISQVIATKIRSGRINNRDELVNYLEEKGFKIETNSIKGKELKTCIKIERIVSDKNGKAKTQWLTLKGPVFHKNADYKQLVKQADQMTINQKLTPEKRIEILTRLRDGIDYREQFYKKALVIKQRKSTFKIPAKYNIGAKDNVKLPKIDNNKGPKVEVPESSVNKKSNDYVSKNIPNIMNEKSNKGSQNTSNSASSGTPAGNGSIESLNISISSLKNNMTALIVQLSQAPPEKKATIERQINQLKMQILQLQLRLAEAKKAEWNRGNKLSH